MNKKVALITGAGRGIGASIAYKLHNDGYAIAAVDRGTLADKDELQPLLQEQDVIRIRASIAFTEDRQRILDEVIKRFGRIDVLVNNAGVAPKVRMDMLEVTEESWDEVLGINLKGTMFMTQLVANVMTQQQSEGIRGIIINTGSTSAWASSPNRAEYCVSKAGVSMLTTLYADRLAEYGILVYEIRPGVIATNMTEVVKDKYDALIARGDFPIARWGIPEDIALAVSSLCEGKFRYSTGEVINVDGGYHIRRL